MSLLFETPNWKHKVIEMCLHIIKKTVFKRNIKFDKECCVIDMKLKHKGNLKNLLTGELNHLHVHRGLSELHTCIS